MSKNGSAIGNDGSLSRRLACPFTNAVNAGIIARHRDQNCGGVRRDVTDAEKKICIIFSNNGKDIKHKWVGHFPNKPEEYHIENRDAIKILIKNNVWLKPANKEMLPVLMEKIALEYKAKKNL